MAFPAGDFFRSPFLDPAFATICDGVGLTAIAGSLPVIAGLPLPDFASSLGEVIEPARARLDHCIADLLDIFEVTLAGDVVVPVLIVTEVYPQGGVTSTDLDEQPVAVVEVTQHAGHELLEAIVHEVTHGLLMINTSTEQPLISVQQTAPAGRHQLWHVPLFLTAAELVRRHIDPKHVDYGTSHGYYAGCAADTETALRWWPRRLSGSLSLAETCQGLRL